MRLLDDMTLRERRRRMLRAAQHDAWVRMRLTRKTFGVDTPEYRGARAIFMRAHVLMSKDDREAS